MKIFFFFHWNFGFRWLAIRNKGPKCRREESLNFNQNRQKNKLQAKNWQNHQKNHQPLQLISKISVCIVDFSSIFWKNWCLHLLAWSFDPTAPNFSTLIWRSRFGWSWAPSSASLVLWSNNSQLPHVDQTIQIWSELQQSISCAFYGPNWIWMWSNCQNWIPTAIWWSNGHISPRFRSNSYFGPIFFFYK